jgi:hypothetical protein
VLIECAACSLFDFHQHVFMVSACNDFAEGDARSESEEFPAAQHLARELIKKRQTLTVWPRFA